MAQPPGDAPDFVRLATPRLVGQIVATGAGPAYGTALLHASPASQGLMLIWQGGGVFSGGVTVVNVSITDENGNTWLDWTPAAGTAAIPILAAPYFEVAALGFSVSVTLSAPVVAGTVLGSVYELDTPPGGWAYAPSAQPIPVTFPLTPSVDIVAPMGQTDAFHSIPVTLATDRSVLVNPVSATMKVLAFNVNGLANAVANLVPAAANFTIRIYSYAVTVMCFGGMPAGQFYSAQLRDTVAHGGFAWVSGVFMSASGQASVPISQSFEGGFDLPADAGIEVIFGNSAPGQQTILIGSVAYTSRVTGTLP
jgi:hypothetical protein